MKINICIPVFNEESNLEDFINSIEDFIINTSHKDVHYSVIFYDDGSTDNSLNIIRNSNFKSISELNNKGLGYAINRLFEYSRDTGADGVIKIDCDGQMLIEEIDLFIEKVKKDSAIDLIQGNRFTNSKDLKISSLKKSGIKFFKLLFKFLRINIQDTSNGFIYVSKRWLEDYKIIGNYNAAQQILLDTKFRNLNFVEQDVTIKNRESGKSFVGLRYPFNVISTLISLAFYRRAKQALIMPGVFSVFVGLILFINDFFLWALGEENKIITNNIIIFLVIMGIQLLSIGLLIEFLKKQKTI